MGRRTIVLPPGAVLRCDTWFNGFFERYWRTYTNLEALAFRAWISGDGILRLFRRLPGEADRLLRELHFSGGNREVVATVPESDTPAEQGLLFFEIAARSRVMLHRAEWAARDAMPRAVRIVVGYCTYNRAPQLTQNVAALLGDADVSELLERIVVVDQGRDKVRDHPSFASLAGTGRLRLIEQPNYGGAGGFTRCLLEAHAEASATHVLLMDDDVITEPESVLRAVAFLSLVREELAVGGHMLDQGRPREVFEVGSRYRPERLRMEDPIRHRVDRADGLTPFLEIRPGHFNGWWFFAFPLAALDRVGLPLPLFLRGDDVEFGYRLRRAGVPTVSLPGVSVWHESFERKGRGWQPYYELRNLLIVGALHFPLSGAASVARQFFSRLLDELLIYDYYEAWLLCEAMTAFLRGPAPLRASPRGIHERLLAAGVRLARTTWPREDCPSGDAAGEPPSCLGSARIGRLLLVLQNIVRGSPRADAAPDRVIQPADEQWYGIAGADVVAVEESGRTDLVVLRRSRGRFVRLLLRGIGLAVWLLVGHRRAVRRWQEGAPGLTTPRFWQEYLGLKQVPRFAARCPSRLNGVSSEPN